ncbi:hypothetical protein T09_9236 [Trichinella sp. T9]|nr:hypothetical protein T09_9236 [Trichinella sp. T9]
MFYVQLRVVPDVFKCIFTLLTNKSFVVADILPFSFLTNHRRACNNFCLLRCTLLSSHRRLFRKQICEGFHCEKPLTDFHDVDRENVAFLSSIYFAKFAFYTENFENSSSCYQCFVLGI